ncbi:unnamed protein product [Prorocentrum cordatum]|uniref:EF-hand domain-containing protein n=1 Tax=Prorocentrum cordatum TaxID=2364126 RepID=A0ABN9QLN7_9DINO|nr:unnamed protein product [Polarella glacialis]
MFQLRWAPAEMSVDRSHITLLRSACRGTRRCGPDFGSGEAPRPRVLGSRLCEQGQRQYNVCPWSHVRFASRASTSPPPIVYENMMREEGFQKRVAVPRAQLDISHDGIVTCEEFMRMGPQLVLPTRELQLEASFYGHCSVALRKATRAQRAIDRAQAADGEDSESSDEGCLQS